MVTRHAHLIRTGRVVTTDQWADYLIYRFYPGMRVYVDGRSDFYGPTLGKEYVRLSYGQYNWRSTVERHRFTVALVPAEWSLASLLKEDTRWRLVEDNGKALLFVRVSTPSRPAQTGPLTRTGKKSGAPLSKAAGPSDHPIGDFSGMKATKPPAPAAAPPGSDPAFDADGWRLTSGLQLAEFALRGGFIAPGLLPKPNLSAPVRRGAAAAEPLARPARARARVSRKSGGPAEAVATEESLG
jgi:hypothetical protein